MADIMDFPKTAEEFINDFKFKDRFEVYTNGSDLIPVFRVEQMIEHYFKATTNVTAAADRTPHGKREQMNKEKKIVEMAKDICDICHQRHNCQSYKYCTMAELVAEGLREAGYCKQREGENITKNHPVDEFICSECGAIFRDVPLIVIDEDDGDELYYEFVFKHCPRCGAKIITE